MKEPKKKLSNEETQRRLLEAASEVFTESGYEAATVREICARAGANIAAVNYHFGDKMGLYRQVLLQSLAPVERASMEVLREAAPEEALRLFVRGIVGQFMESNDATSRMRILVHELARPTGAMEGVVARVIRPKSTVLCGIVAQLLGRPASDRRTQMCAQSVMGQVLHQIHARRIMEILWPELKQNPRTAEEIAAHISEYSIEAIKGIRRNYERAAKKGKK